MCNVTFSSLLLLPTFVTLLAYPRSLFASEVKKPLLTPQLASLKRTCARDPHFVATANKLYLFWSELETDTPALSITDIDNETKHLGSLRKVPTTEESGVVPMYAALYAAMPVEASPPPTKSLPTFLVVYAGMTQFDGAGGHYLVTQFMPNQKKDAYAIDKKGNFLPRNPGWQFRGMGLINPGQVSFLRRAGKMSPLFLVGSNYSQTWSITSSDGGKTWTTPHIIAKDEDQAQVVETTSGELLLFSSAQNRASEGRRAEIRLRRSKGGKTWSDSKWIIEAHNLQKTCAFVDRKAIWLAYADKNEKRAGSTIYLTRSSDDGKTWEEALPLTDGTHDDSGPALAVQDGTLFLAFVRTIPRRPGAREDDVKHQIWYGHKAVKEIKFPRAE